MQLTHSVRPEIDASLIETFDRFYGAPSLAGPVTARAKYAKGYELSENAAERDNEISIAQYALRPLYGKGPPAPPSIGDHPDFLYLKGTDETCYSPITTMFMDIESSTRLCLLHNLDDVRKIKNAFIQTAIQIIRCFDGHVHRIMGDAVMAYFGRVGQKTENGVIDCLNCVAVLRYFVENIVSERLQEWGYGDGFGARIGIDYGARDKVLWGTYGVPGMQEVTATSFNVDVAAKLQQSASRNQVMLGQSIAELIDVPDELRLVTNECRDGKEYQTPFVRPNHSDADGNKINYKQWEFKADEFLRCTPIALKSKRFIQHTGFQPVPMKAYVYSADKTCCEGEYHAASRILPKDKYLKFELQIANPMPLPYRIQWEVENHGTEAWDVDPQKAGSHVTSYSAETQQKPEAFENWESTAYRGLHYMIAKVFVRNQLKYMSRFGVFIE